MRLTEPTSMSEAPLSSDRVLPSEEPQEGSIREPGIFAGEVILSTKELEDHEGVLQWLRKADRLSVRKLFHTLPAPPIGVLCGEFDAELLDQGGRLPQKVTQWAFGAYGIWLGKAFRPISEESGEGYNYFQGRDDVIRKLPMDTFIEPSVLDNNPAMKLSYKDRNRGLIRQLVGEIRQVTQEILLGIGVFTPQVGGKSLCQRKIPFMMVGPQRGYHTQG